MSTPLGLLAGTSLLNSDFLNSFDENVVSTDNGPVTIYRLPGLIAIQRHAGPDGYRPPHRIRHEAHFRVFDQFDVDRVLSIQSAGSLRESISPGSFLLPDDFIQPWKVVTAFDHERGHVVAEFDDELRNQISRIMKSLGLSLHESGTYIQTQGPRFETPAEAKMLADYGDCVGMTAASELIIASQMDINYATLCSVDNYVNGIAKTRITLERFREAVKAHESEVKRAVLHLLEGIADINRKDILS